FAAAFSTLPALAAFSAGSAATTAAAIVVVLLLDQLIEVFDDLVLDLAGFVAGVFLVQAVFGIGQVLLDALNNDGRVLTGLVVAELFQIGQLALGLLSFFLGILEIRLGVFLGIVRPDFLFQDVRRIVFLGE